MERLSLTASEQIAEDNGVLDQFRDAEVLAWAANNAFDRRLASAGNLSDVVDYSSTRPGAYSIAETTFKKDDEQFELFKKAAIVKMPSYEALKLRGPKEPFASESVWAAMSIEKRIEAADVPEPLAEQLKNYGVTPASLRVVSYESPEGETVFTLIYTGKGIDLGTPGKLYDYFRSYNSVMGKTNDHLFKVEVNGRDYDARSGMNHKAYTALYEDAL